MAIFKGAAVAIVTPMHEDGKVNYEKLEGKRRWAPAAEGEAGPGRQKNWTEGGNCTKSPEKGAERGKGIQYIHLFGKNER